MIDQKNETGHGLHCQTGQIGLDPEPLQCPAAMQIALPVSFSGGYQAVRRSAPEQNQGVDARYPAHAEIIAN